MELKPFYTYSEIARLEGKTTRTIEGWISDDRKLPTEERRFPGAFGGSVPLADVKARYGLTNAELREMDLPAPRKRGEVAAQ